jgi:hypothetical protein
MKPLATKLEKNNRRELARSVVDLQAVMLLYERHHPEHIRELINETHPRSPSQMAALSSSYG